MIDHFDLNLWPGFKKAGGDTSKPSIVDQITIDSRRIDSPHSLFVALRGENNDGHDFITDAIQAGAKYVLVNKPGLTVDGATVLYSENPLRSFQEIAKTYRSQMTCKVIAITGSYGKTMLKDLLGQVLSEEMSVITSPESFNSQIGVPLSLLNIKKHHEIALIEAAISKAGEMDILAQLIDPDHTIMTYVGDKHLHTLGNLENATFEMSKLLNKTPLDNWVLAPKQCIIDRQKVLWDYSDSNLPFVKRSNKPSFLFKWPDGQTYETSFSVGFTYLEDLLNICTKAAWLLGVSKESFVKALDNYHPEPMRLEIWQSPHGTTILNDSYGSDPQSVDRALRVLDKLNRNGSKHIIFGGLRSPVHKTADYKHVAHLIKTANIDLTVLLGSKDYTEISNPALRCNTYQEAINHLKDRMRPDDTILIKGDRKIDIDDIIKSIQGSVCTTQLQINLAHIESNINQLRQKLGSKTRVMAIIKANAYGTDDVLIAKWLSGCGVDIFGVSYVDEAIALKRSGIKQTLFALHAAPHEITKVVNSNIEIGVHDKSMIEALNEEASSQNKTIYVHLHVDTGMSRLGCRPEEALLLAELITQLPSLKLEGIMTHFASADSSEHDSFTQSQIESFDKVIANIEEKGIQIPWKHAANSSAALRFDLPQYNMARIGLAMYGISQFKTQLKLALSLVSRIVGINTCKKGETISYGRSYTVQKEFQKIAVIPVGYFDGINQNYSGKGTVLIHGQKAPIVGKICMDFMMVDVTDLREVSINDQVLIFGEDEFGHYQAPEELAKQGNTITHELITCLGPRIARIFIHDEKP